MHRIYFIFRITLIFIGFSAPAFAQSGEGDTISSPFLKPMLTVFPEEPQVGDEVRIIIQGVLPGAAYQFIPPEEPVELIPLDERSHLIFLNAQVIENVVPDPDNQTTIAHEINLGVLDLGRYEVILSVNDREVYQTKFFIQNEVVEQPTPVSSDLVSRYGASLVLEPAHPQPGEEFSIYAAGEFPSTGYSIEIESFRVTKSNPAAVIVNLAVQTPSNEQDDVIVPFNELAGTVALPEGNHTLMGALNGELFFIGTLAVESESTVVTNPQPWLNNITLEIVPAFPKPDEIFSIYVTGEFTGSSYQFTSKQLNILESYPVQLSVNLELTAPDEPGEEEKTPFREFVSTHALPEGEYSISATINGMRFHSGKVIVAEYNPISQGPILEPKIIFEPAHPQPGEEFTVYAAGDFPTPGYSFTHTSLSTVVYRENSDNYDLAPEQLMIELEVEQPTEPQAQVLTPYNQLIGTATLGEGEHLVLGTINKIPFYRGVLLVGDDPNPLLLRFERSGGFAGFFAAIDVYQNGHVEYTHDPKLEGQPERGWIQPERFEEVLALLDAIPFEALEPIYEPETPIADGYQYLLNYGEEFTVQMAQGAELPSDLESLRAILEEILDGRLLEEPEIPSEPEKPVTIYNPGIVLDPAEPQPNKEFSITLTGEFPSPGYTFVEKRINIAESYPEQLFIDIVVREPDGPAAAVITPFKEILGVTALGEGNHPVYVSVNGERVYSGVIPIGNVAEEEPIIEFERSGGIQGAVTMIHVYENGFVIFDYQTGEEDGLQYGQVYDSTLEELNKLVNLIPFDTLETHYKAQTPIVDGFNYRMNYMNQNDVRVDQGAEIPEDLGAVLNLLEGILDSGPLREEDENTTAVDDWLMM